MVVRGEYRALADAVGSEDVEEEGMLQHLLAVLCLDPCGLLPGERRWVKRAWGARHASTCSETGRDGLRRGGTKRKDGTVSSGGPLLRCALMLSPAAPGSWAFAGQDEAAFCLCIHQASRGDVSPPPPASPQNCAGLRALGGSPPPARSRGVDGWGCQLAPPHVLSPLLLPREVQTRICTPIDFD